jgi:hypothetical protein
MAVDGSCVDGTVACLSVLDVGPDRIDQRAYELVPADLPLLSPGDR